MIHLICGSTGAGKTTYAGRLCEQFGALHLSIDDWMVTLFAPDKPARPDWPWIEERAGRCERQILATALQAGRVGMPSILDLGLQRADQRRRIAEWAAAAGLAVRLHFLDVDADERWRRVEQRNEEQGETFRLKVTRPMFDFIETMWQPPTADEMSVLNGVRIAV
ncbi:ATP-binding protein [uncultured Reyranella sp.]|uniref:AAA family ATPase n=1 Tax=uncultured Reyranella sp. TaxID=735512 RepID=UPI00259D07B6|nr:ATP-binding protein [uncultured Reyranella sp.]